MTERPTISNIFSLYDKALNQTRKKLEDNAFRSKNELKEFFNEFLKTQTIQYEPLFKNEAFRREIHRELQQRNRSNTLRFWAIDGACLKVDTSEIAIFYGGAYVVKGELALQDNPPLLSYHESEPEDDSSLVAYLPLSPEDLTVIYEEERFFVNDAERVTTSGLDTSLMLLAEIYLLYRGATADDHPHLLLWDNSLSSVLANATPNVRHLRFTGLKISGETVWYPDLLVGYSKPWNSKIDIPSRKAHRLWERAIAKIFESDNKKLDLNEFSRDVRINKEKVVGQLSLLWECDKYGNKHQGNPKDALVYKKGDELTLNSAYINSPDKIERLYRYFCGKFFKEKDPSILLYIFEDENGMERTRFLSSEEISFLMAIGLRLTFESCWKNGIMLIGIAKDSASTYFTTNYLGVMRDKGIYSFTPRFIPGTDRLTFERVPIINDDILGPWGSTEFDAVFMTLRMKQDLWASKPTLQGIRGDILLQPNLIMRSLIQFYLVRDPSMEPLMGHVLFVDRLVHYTNKYPNLPEKVKIIENDNDLGTIEPFYYENNSKENMEQIIAIYLLSVLTRNVFPQVIGYPDPLHYADRGAKSVLKMVEPMLRSSEWLNRSDPINRKLRQNRGG